MGLAEETTASAIREVDRLVGIDIQGNRDSPYAVLSKDGRMVDSGWIRGGTDTERCRFLLDKVKQLETDARGPIAFGIDSPRGFLPRPRRFYPVYKKSCWRPRKQDEKGHGRHCELIISTLRIAIPQWTPVQSDLRPDQDWMKTGAALFEALAGRPHVYEVFPSASYKLLAGEPNARIEIDFAQFTPGPKDMLDACLGAFTVSEFLNGRGCEVGNADGLGAIVLPRDKTSDIPEFMVTIPSELLDGTD